jgi:nucleotide sugar dehydrogenase
LRIQVVGVGVVGSAQAYLLSRLGHAVLGYDHHRTSFEYATMVKEIQKDVDLTFVCVPEAGVPDVVKDLAFKKVKGLYVIKSTVPSGTTLSLMADLHLHICHNPEFLREEKAFEDVLNPNFVVIGQCCPEHAAVLQKLYSPLKCPIKVTQPTVSETLKVTLNSYLATLISFWNEINEVAIKLNLTTKELAELACLDPRVSRYGTGFFGAPFGGKCLPKDLDQLIGIGLKAGVKPQLLEAIREYNRSLNVNSL